MDNPVSIVHKRGTLVVADGYFTKMSPNARLYKEEFAKKGDGKLIWRDNFINRFKPEDLHLPDGAK